MDWTFVAHRETADKASSYQSVNAVQPRSHITGLMSLQ